jgi:hypothetical protein
MVITMTQIADREAHARRDGETIASNMCDGCIRHAQADGWRIISYPATPSIEPCDWCNAETSVPDFHPPYVVPNYPEPDIADEPDNVCQMADYFDMPWMNHRHCGNC